MHHCITITLIALINRVCGHYLVIGIIDSWEGAFVALRPGLNGKVGLGHSTTGHTLHSTLFSILQHHRDERARDYRG